VERRDHIARDEFQGAAIGVDHDVHDEIAASLAADPGVFLVDRIALQDAASIAGLLITTEAMIGDDTRKDAA